MGRKKGAKSPKSTKCYDDLPAWYRRLMSNPDPYHEVYPEEFDEDLSEIHESEESEDETDYESPLGDECSEENEDCHKECNCDGDNPDCECLTSAGDDQYDHASNDSERWDGEQSEEESERSYKEDDADYYYELKKSRVERKRELREHMKHQEESLRRVRVLHEEKEKEVRAMRECLVQASMEVEGKIEDTVKMGSGKSNEQCRPRLELVGKHFKLYSTEYLDHFLSPSLMDTYVHDPYVEFYQMTADGTWGDPVTGISLSDTDCDPAKLDGHIAYLTPDFDCHFEPFRIHEYAGTQTVVLESWHKEHKVEFEIEFLGDDYLILRVGRDLIINYEGERQKKILCEQSKCADAPEMLEFVGIHYDFRKRRAEMQLQEEAKRTRREPRETFFEMSHPMGWWNWSRSYG